ncbi:NAD(P)-binding domain-containing protein [Escherichia coli]
MAAIAFIGLGQMGSPMARTALCLACLQSGKPDQEKTCRP